jgi:hypothetical protein
LLGTVIFSTIRYVGELKARFRLQGSLAQVQGAVVALTQERQNLLQELGKEKKHNEQLMVKNVNLKTYLRASKERIRRLFRDSSKTTGLAIERNQGFLSRNGRPTVEKIKIEVIPASYKSSRDYTGP